MRRKYFIAKSRECTEKNGQANSARQILETIDCIFQIFWSSANEFDDTLPRFVLHNMIRNNENIFGTGFDTEKSKISEFEMKETKTTTSNNQEFARFFEVPGLSIRLTRDAEVDTLKTKNDKRTMNHEKGLKTYQESENNSALMRENEMGIRSMTIIRESENIGVEIEIGNPDEKSLKRLEDYRASGIANYPYSAGERTKSPFSSSQKSIESFSYNSFFDVDYSNTNILYFLSQRLLSIIYYRNMCMKKIHNCLERILDFVSNFHSAITKLNTLVEGFSLTKEIKVSVQFYRMRNEILRKVRMLSEKGLLLLKYIEKDVDVWKNSLAKIEEFEEDQGQLLSANNKKILTIDDLKKLEFHLNEICKQSDEILNHLDARKAILVNLSDDFEQLAKHCVTFLILTEILEPQKW